MKNCSCRNEKSKQKNCQFVQKPTVFWVWRRERDLNPCIHSCITRFRIVRVQPLRHLCKQLLYYTSFHMKKQVFLWDFQGFFYKSYVKIKSFLH